MRVCIYSGNFAILVYACEYSEIFSFSVYVCVCIALLSNVLILPSCVCICHINRKIILSFLSLECVHTCIIDNLSICVIHAW